MLFGFLKFWHSSEHIYQSGHHKPFFFNHEVWFRISTWLRRFHVFRSDTNVLSEEKRLDFSWYKLESTPQFEQALDWVILFCARRKQDLFSQKSDDSVLTGSFNTKINICSSYQNDHQRIDQRTTGLYMVEHRNQNYKRVHGKKQIRTKMGSWRTDVLGGASLYTSITLRP